MDFVQEPAQLLGDDGPLARRIPGFAARAQQQEMADAVARALAAGEVLVTEAGTGTGKTFAYLVPALLSGGKVLISTGTKTLQDQLFHRDIPLVRAALASPARTALLKGRANYLCLHRLQEAGRAPEMAAAGFAARWQRVQAWAAETRSGEIAEIADIPEDDPFWYQVTSSADNCLGQDCAFYNDCHVLKARRAAQEADIVVINHHLLFSDIVLRREGFGELLPDADAFILDEAHQLPALASNFFGTLLGGRQLRELARDTVRAMQAECPDMPELAREAQHLEQCVEEFHRALGQAPRQAAWTAVLGRAEVGAGLHRLQDGLAALRDRIEIAAGRGQAIDSCGRRCQDLSGRLEQFAADTSGAEADADDAMEHIAWFETGKRSFVLRRTPLDPAPAFRACMEQYRRAWVFTSATLAVGGAFEHFTARLGIEAAATGRWDSPFDFSSNALLYLPENLPDPGTPRHTAAAVEAMLPVLEASGGRAFVLFTSHRALQEAAALFERHAPDYPLLIQGRLPRSALLARFRAAGNAVLLGTGSFWEGIDVRGPALSCVIIDKLPFGTPDDPVLQARADLIRRRGGNPFRDYQLPQAVIALKQGGGRLIRDVHDRGVLMICDPRLLTRSYGKVFLNNLPDMRRTRSLPEVCRFLREETGAIEDPACAPEAEPS